MVGIGTIAVNWLLISALYALVAIGFTLIFGVGGVLNLAHGASIAIGAYTAYVVTTNFGASIWVGALGALVVSGLFSLGLYLLLVRRVQDQPITVMILTLVTWLIVEQVFVVGIGTTPRSVASLLGGSVAIAGVTIRNNRLLVFVLSWVIIGALFVFVTRTRWGKAILAVSMSHRGATLVGIDADRIFGLTWLIAGMLAGVAGLFLASFQTATPFIGRTPLLLSFSIVVLGGIGSIRGSVIGAYLVGLLDVVTVSLISTRLSGLLPLVVLVGVLLVRPSGLFGRELVE